MFLLFYLYNSDPATGTTNYPGYRRNKYPSVSSRFDTTGKLESSPRSTLAAANTLTITTLRLFVVVQIWSLSLLPYLFSLLTNETSNQLTLYTPISLSMNLAYIYLKHSFLDVSDQILNFYCGGVASSQSFHFHTFHAISIEYCWKWR